jgi:hypothetical protein
MVRSKFNIEDDQCTRRRHFLCSYNTKPTHNLEISFSKKDVEILTKVIHTIVLLLTDSNVVVVKKVMLCLTQLYRLMLQVRPSCFAVGW